MTKLAEVEGIGDVYAGKLEAAGIPTLEAYLEKAATRAGRKEIAETAEISETLILKWANRADLARVNGIGSEFADLLEAAGVDTVPELAQRNAANLAAKLEEVNAAKHLVRRLPSESEVSGWVEQAKALPRVLEY